MGVSTSKVRNQAKNGRSTTTTIPQVDHHVSNHDHDEVEVKTQRIYSKSPRHDIPSIPQNVPKKRSSQLHLSKSFACQTSNQSTTIHRPSVFNFDLIAVIGRGSFGKVFKVRHRETNTYYAMKVIRKDKIVQNSAMANLIREEKDILQKIKHPFIVKLRYAFHTKEKLYLVMDYLSGGELYYQLKTLGKFSIERARFYAGEIFLAIHYLHHEMGILYRDLKSENLVIDKAGHIVLTDMGLCFRTYENTARHESPQESCGTPEYLAPELLKVQMIGHERYVGLAPEPKFSTKSDWWAFGILLFEMICGFAPWQTSNIAQLYEHILHSPLRIPNDVPESAKQLLKGLLEKNPRRRFSANDIRTHPFFWPINWEKLEKKQIKVPYDPSRDGHISSLNEETDDLSNFDPIFVDEPARDSFVFTTNDSPLSNKETDMNYDVEYDDFFSDYFFNSDTQAISKSENSFFLDEIIQIDAEVNRKEHRVTKRRKRSFLKSSSSNAIPILENPITNTGSQVKDS